MRSLHAQLGVILLGFLLLVGGSAVATILAVRAQASDALLVNVAGRQRMLVQQIVKDALLAGQGGAGAAALEEADRAFAADLAALIHGGPVRVLSDRAVVVPASRDPGIRHGLGQVERAWSAFHAEVARVIEAPRASPEARTALEALERSAPELIQKTDAVVSLYEAASARKIARLKGIQGVFLGSGLLLLTAGIRTTRRSVLRPLRDLSRAASRIGGGDLRSPVPPQGLREVATVANSLETMRGQLEASQRTLRAWADELEDRVARRTQELVALFEVSREISSRLEIDHILRSVTDKARALLGADVGALCLVDDDGRVLNLQSTSGPKEAIVSACLPVQDPPADQVLVAERALACGASGCAGACSMLAAPFRASHLAARLQVGDRVIGALCVCSGRSDAFAADAANLLTKLADSVAIALENARLYQQAERLAMLEERQRIAAEMHDGAAQTLGFLELKAGEISALAAAGRAGEAADGLGRMRAVMAQASREMRQAIAALQEPPSAPLTLHERLTRLVQESEAHGEPGARVTSILLPPPLVLPPEASEQVLRVVGEALVNAQRHARAEQITVRLEQRAGEASVTVEDDGRGFDPKAPCPDGASHFGLSIMRARAARLGGRLEVVSAPGSGTRVGLRWPAAPAHDGASAAPPERL
ncbi:MAG: type IV pili methyl-accepting chemotaxis transducer N-terminal domain-containing protein [Deltaproteobacteria bacterium]|nr:type IV pili methyl-accepting chemotaxis transducer N-terminal domain-containing protein [Deltaproteobacteria bacterium]